MTVSQVELQSLINGVRLAGDIAQRTPPGSTFLMVLAPPGDSSCYHKTPMEEKWWSWGTNQAFSRKVLGLSQGIANLLGEQTLDLQTWESKSFRTLERAALLCWCQRGDSFKWSNLTSASGGRWPVWKAGEAGREQGPNEAPCELLLCERFI